MDGSDGTEDGVNGEVRRRTQASNEDMTNSNSQPSSTYNGTNTTGDNQQQQQLSVNSEYCKQLENWLWKCYWHRTIAVSAYFTALNQNYGSSTSHTESIPTLRTQPRIRVIRQQPFRLNVANLGNNEYQRLANGEAVLSLAKIAPIWKRLVAEVIDFVILMLIKLVVTFTIVDNFDIIDFDSIDLSLQNQDGDIHISSLYELAFTISSELIILEIMHRLIACIMEGYCLSKSGCSPGKSLLNIRVIHAESIISVPHPNNPAATDTQFVLVAPASNLTFPRAFFRSAVKNFSLAFFFPLCFTLFHFDHSRTLYDVMGKSLVIENS